MVRASIITVANKEFRFSDVYKPSYWLFVDTHKVSHYLRHLRYQYFGGYMCQDSEYQDSLK